MLNLPEVTLISVDTRAPSVALRALQYSLAHARFARAILFTHPIDAVPHTDGIERIDSGPLDSITAYSHFMVRRLAAFIDTRHVLVSQWDGFVVDPSAWSDEFLQWDYIGAPWPHEPAPFNVGNGGFSLRSRRLLEAGADARIEQVHPEDRVLCVQYRALLEREHGLRFATAEVARRFSFEREEPAGPCFGFHGAHHLPRFLDEQRMAQWLDELPEGYTGGRETRRIARGLMRHRMSALAWRLMQRRMQAGTRDWRTCATAAAARGLAAMGR